MRVFESLEAIRHEDFTEGTCVAIGKFDGLHLGHQAILRRLVADAQAAGRRAVVFTFANNPLSLLRPDACPDLLMSPQQRVETFAALGVDDCVMIEFDAEIASITAEDFVTDVLVGVLHAQHIIMGANFRFGYRGAGDGELLTRLGGELGFTADVLDLVADPGLVGFQPAPGDTTADTMISSSSIRDALGRGDVGCAARMLGRLPVVRGEVVHGDARGREIGYPTANLGGAIEGLVPADGVYAGWVLLGDAVGSGECEGGGSATEPSLRPAAISVGNNPTFTPDAQSRVEAYLLDFSGDLYGQRMEVRFAFRLRGTERFESLEALLTQMALDVQRSRELLA